MWVDYNQPDSYSGDIVVYDLTTQTSKQLTIDPIRQLRLKIQGDRVVWTDERWGTSFSDLYINGKKPNSDVFFYNFRTGEERLISEDKVDDVGMISDHWVLYAEVTDMMPPSASSP